MTEHGSESPRESEEEGGTFDRETDTLTKITKALSKAEEDQRRLFRVESFISGLMSGERPPAAIRADLEKVLNKALAEYRKLLAGRINGSRDQIRRLQREIDKRQGKKASSPKKEKGKKNAGAHDEGESKPQ